MKRQAPAVPKSNPLQGPGERRVIKTARTKDAINDAARHGYWPLVKPVEPSQEIRSKVAVFQNPQTGEIRLSGDYRGDTAGVKVIDFVEYYPHHFPNPYAAYLVPADLADGEEVWLEDLIEDVVESRWNQGDAYRLAACAAVWNGKDFRILFDPEQHARSFVG